MSNVLGSLNPIKELIELAKENSVYTVIDGAQGAPHTDVNVCDLGCDFYTFSAHKIMGPTGVGVLYGRKELLEQMPPYRTGGNMIAKVTPEETSWNVLPNKFEAGTPNIADVLGLEACYQYISKLDRKTLWKHEKHLSELLTHEIKKMENFVTYNDNPNGIVSFSHKSIHSHDISFVADSHGVCIRSGHLCAQPLMQALDVNSLSRASFYLYNDENDVNKLLKALFEAEQIFSL